MSAMPRLTIAHQENQEPYVYLSDPVGEKGS
jgi:hypothetical protein